MLSRRSVIGSLAAASPLLATANPVVTASSADAPLLALGRDFAAAAARLDHAIANRIDIDDGLLEQLSRLDAKIVATQAVTIQGLYVKARAACWALLGDLDPAGQSTTDKRMALSIVRDLVRQHDSGLERPGALRGFIKEIEDSANQQPAA